MIIEDDPYRRLRFYGADLASMASLDRKSVISVGSFSKTFAPGVRVGWAVADREVVSAMARAKQVADSCTSSLGQRLIVAFHRRHDVAAHYRALQDIYRTRSEAAVAALQEAFGDIPGFRWTRPSGGFYTWVELPRDQSARLMFEERSPRRCCVRAG